MHKTITSKRRAAVTSATVTIAAVALASSVGCGGNARTPDAYRDDTAKLLATASEGITNCYNQVLKTNPTASGSVTVRFVVQDDTGKLRRIKVDPARSSAPPAVQECVTKYISDLKLEPADSQKGVAMFSWDFSFKTVTPPDAAAPADSSKPPS
jgi:hypothetical protein